MGFSKVRYRGIAKKIKLHTNVVVSCFCKLHVQNANFIKNKSDNFSSMSKSEQYEIIISSIADISYDYYISQNLAELSKQKLDLMLSELLQDAINMETDEIKSSLKKRSVPYKR